MESIEHYLTKYHNVTSWRQEKCTLKYVTICMDGVGVTRSFAAFRAAHKLLVVHIMLDINKVP